MSAPSPDARETSDPYARAVSVVNLHGFHTSRSRLLTGTLVCGRCGTRMDGRPGRGHIQPSYGCPDTAGCGRARVVEHELDEVVYAAIVGKLRSPKGVRAVQPASGDDVEVPAEVD